MSETHEFPQLYIGCPVEVWTDPSKGDVTLGLVRRPKTSNADVIAFTEGGPIHLYDCLVETDPRIQTMPAEEWQYQRGIFRLSPGELQRRELVARLDRIEEMLGKLAGEMELTKMPDESKAKRRPGRPRKPTPAEAEDLQPAEV